MTDDRGSDPEIARESDRATDALLSRLRLIEEQRLDERESAYGHVRDELQSELDAGPR